MTYYSSPQITDKQTQVILGTVLGGSSIYKPTGGKNCYLSMRDKNHNWLEYKANILNSLASERPFTLDKKSHKWHMWHSCCYPAFTEFRELFYNDGKKLVTKEILSKLRDEGHAIWCGDSGQNIDGDIYLNASRLGGKEIIAKYFQEIGIDVKIVKNKIKIISLQSYIKLVGHCLPKFIR